MIPPEPPTALSRLAHRGLLWALAGLLAAPLAGCGGEDGSDPGVTPPIQDAAIDDGAAEIPLILTLDRAPLPPTSPLQRDPLHLRIQVDSLVTDARTTFDLGVGPVDWPATVEVGDLKPGRYRITAYFDRDQNERHDGCPFPPDPEWSSRADELDNLFGIAEAAHDGTPVEVRIERHICGPGDDATGLKGTLSAAGSAASIHLRLEPIYQPEMPMEPGGTDEPEEPDPAMQPAPIVVPLFPDGLEGTANFEFGGLLPGTYRLIFFEDGDGNGQFTPCGPDIGGGDRLFAVQEEVVIPPGVRTQLSDPSTLEAAEGCPTDLTGVEGALNLGPMLTRRLEAEAEAEETPLADELYGDQVRFTLLDADGNPEIDVPLFDRLSDRPLPRVFTLTGLPTGVWQAAIYLDRDEDGWFSPCGGLPGGLDRAYVRLESVRIEAGLLEDLGEVALSMPRDCSADNTGVTGKLILEQEPGSAGSGRPVRLDLIPVSGGDRRSLLLFENHRILMDNAPEQDPDEEPPHFRFTVAGGVPAGEYRALVYLDTNRDGFYQSCTTDPYGDRASVAVSGEEGLLRIRADEILDLGTLRLALETDMDGALCPVPRAVVNPTVEWTDSSADPPPGVALRLFIQEAGGWSLDYRISQGQDLSQVAFPLTLDNLRDTADARDPSMGLAPGRYRLVVYADTEPDGAYGICESESPDTWSASAEVVLDTRTPDAQPRLQLLPACSR